MSITEKFFLDSIQSFDKIEKRTGFFTLSTNLANQGNFEEAYILILATWNFANFRYFLKNFDLPRYTTSPQDYYNFLTDMRSRFFIFENLLEGKTLAKAIDEFNYVNITIEYQKQFTKKKNSEKKN